MRQRHLEWLERQKQLAERETTGSGRRQPAVARDKDRRRQLDLFAEARPPAETTSIRPKEPEPPRDTPTPSSAMEPRGSMAAFPLPPPADEYRDGMAWRPEYVDLLRGIVRGGQLLCTLHLCLGGGLDVIDDRGPYEPIRWGQPGTYRYQGACCRCGTDIFGERMAERYPMPF